MGSKREEGRAHVERVRINRMKVGRRRAKTGYGSKRLIAQYGEGVNN